MLVCRRHEHTTVDRTDGILALKKLTVSCGGSGTERP